MMQKYVCQGGKIVLFPCAGGCNCGRIAHEVAVSLDVLGIGRLHCLAGIGAHIEGMVESARNSERIVAIDGLVVACARKTLEQAGLKVSDWLCVTEAGIDLTRRLQLDHEEVESITGRAKQLLLKPAQSPK